MLAESNEVLPTYGTSRGMTVFRCNRKTISRPDADGKSQTVYQFENVLVESPLDRKNLIDAVRTDNPNITVSGAELWVDDELKNNPLAPD